MSMTGIALRWSGKSVGKNRMHTFSRGRLIKTNEYRCFLEELSVTFRSQRPTPKTIEGPFKAGIIVTVGPRSDGHNLIDPILDALEQGGIVSNDRNMQTMTLFTRRHRNGEDDGISVYVEEAHSEKGRGTI